MPTSKTEQQPALVYSTDEDSGFSEDFSSMTDGLLCNHENLSAGLVYYVGEKVEHTHTELARGSSDDVIERMQDNAWQQADEHSEGFGDGVKDDAKAELEALIAGWAEKHMPIHFFTVAKIREAALTAEEAAEFDPGATTGSQP